MLSGNQQSQSQVPPPACPPSSGGEDRKEFPIQVQCALRIAETMVNRCTTCGTECKREIPSHHRQGTQKIMEKMDMWITYHKEF